MSAPTTRASVTATSSGVIVIRLAPMRTKLGNAKGGIPSAGERNDSVCQITARTTMVTIVSRRIPANDSGSRGASRDIDDRLVGHLRVEAGFDRALHHVPDHRAVRA